MGLGGALFSRIKTWITGDTLTAADLNAEFNNILTNFNPGGMASDSPDLSTMQTTDDPTGGGLPSPSSLEKEIQRLRFQIKAITGGPYWYTAVSSTPVASGAGIRNASKDLLDRNSNSLFGLSGEVTANNSSTGTTLNINFGSITNGDRILIKGYFSGTGSGAGKRSVSFTNGGGSATVVYDGTASNNITDDRYFADGGSYTVNFTAMCEVTGTGTYTATLWASSGWSTNVDIRGYAVFLKKQ